MLCIICIKTVDETRARASANPGKPDKPDKAGRGARLGTALANQ